MDLFSLLHWIWINVCSVENGSCFFFFFFSWVRFKPCEALMVPGCCCVLLCVSVPFVRVVYYLMEIVWEINSFLDMVIYKKYAFFFWFIFVGIFLFKINSSKSLFMLYLGCNFRMLWAPNLCLCYIWVVILECFEFYVCLFFDIEYDAQYFFLNMLYFKYLYIIFCRTRILNF